MAETGGAFLMPWIDEVGAVLEAWYPGIRGGPAIADVLFGAVNPAGKLPITFPKSEADLPHPVPVGPPKKWPAGQSHRFDVSYSEALKVGYKWYDSENKHPLFPFGFGLSYTTFAYAQLHVDSAKQVRVTFRVKNTGARAGAEIPQIYLGLPKAAGEPPKRLVGWSRIRLQPGESRTVTVIIPSRMLAIFDVEKDG